jgi:hypothetical protein
MDTAGLILSIVSIVISGSAIAISWLLYTKSDSLNKEMLKFVTEIKTLTSSLYSDSFGLVKQSYEKLIAQNLSETDGNFADKTVQEIVDKAALKIEEKFSKEIERVESGEKIREGEINRLRKELKEIVEKIPSEVDKSKKSKSDKISEFILQTIESNPGVTWGNLYKIVQETGFESQSISGPLWKMIIDGTIISSSKSKNVLAFEDKLFLAKRN